MNGSDHEMRADHARLPRERLNVGVLPATPAFRKTAKPLTSHLVELSQTVMHYLGAVFPGDPVSQPNQPALNARQSAGSPEPSREALHEGHRRVASIA
jgi:hypothetical protein